MNPDNWSLAVATGLFTLASMTIVVFGVRLTRVAAQIAVLSRLGQTVIGALLLGSITSLPEVMTSLTAALDNHADLAMGNAIGSVAGQTAFLALVDLAYRKANLEHAAASVENLMLTVFLILMLAIVMLALALPGPAVLGVHPFSLLLFVAYLHGMRMLSRAHAWPMWEPRQTRETETSTRSGAHQGEHPSGSRPWLWLDFLVAGGLTAVSGWLLATTAVPIAHHTGLSQTVVGSLLTGLAGSLPELVTALAAVRMGALSLAVGDILGGNGFDVLIVAMSDFAYPSGSLYAAAAPEQMFLLGLTILLNAILLLGMLFREKHGIANIGQESLLLLICYLGGMGLLLGY